MLLARFRSLAFILLAATPPHYLAISWHLPARYAGHSMKRGGYAAAFLLRRGALPPAPPKEKSGGINPPPAF